MNPITPIQLRIKRHKAYVGALVGLKIYFDNSQLYSLSNGETAVLAIPSRPGYLHIKMFGSSLNIHPIIGEVFIDPTACRQGIIDCDLRIETNWLGIFTFGLACAQGNLKIDVRYC